MAQPTDQPAPRQTLDGLIGEAIGARQMLPPYDRCLELDEQLRAAITGLLPAVQGKAGEAVERSREWYRLRGIVDDTRDVLAAGLGNGLLSAAIQLGDLAERVGRLAAEADRGSY